MDETTTFRPSAMATGVVDWATSTPDRVAVFDVQRTMTFGELDATSAALAARVLDGSRAREAGTPDWLPVVVERSVSSAVAVHGVVRAGCAFARIESTTPRELIGELFARLGSPRRAVVADSKFVELLPAGVEAIPVFGHERVGAAEPQAVDLAAPGRVGFTSGSTGRPKGVIAPWSGFDAMVGNTTAVAPIPAGDHWIAAFPHQFAAGAVLRGMPLPSVGQTWCIADPTVMSIDDLLDWLDARNVESFSLPSSLARAIVRTADGRRRLPSVSLLRFTSEAPDWSLVAPMRRLVGANVTIRAGYSCGEFGTIAHFDIAPGDPIGEGRIPLGYLAPGVELRLEPVDGDPATTRLVLARPRSLGYLGDPELDASRYFTDGDGTRWWRSDDIVRVDDAGMYHFVGRANEMVKVKGSFVAPSRVEHVLKSIDGISAAAVILHPAPNDALRVVAHVQVDDETLTPERVDAELHERLPAELVPAIVMRHDELPTTPRMKLDRRALEQVPLVRWRTTPARISRSEFEWWCVAEARRIIGLDDVGPDDDLFEAGLDSLGALELSAALTDAGFGGFDPPRLFEARSVAGIERMMNGKRDVQRSAVVMLNDGGSRPPLFALPGGAGNALEYRFLAEELGPDQPVAVIELRGMHTRDRPDRTLDARAAHVCEEIEARLDSTDPCVIVGFSGGGPGAYEAGRRMHATGRRVHVVLLDTAPSTRNRRTTGRSQVATEHELLPPTIRTSSFKELPAALWRSAKYRTKYFRFHRLIRNPGPPSHDRLRYLAFQRMQSWFNNAYEPEPATFPVTLVDVEGSDARDRCTPWIANLSVHHLGGNHKTMLVPPYVGEVAVIVAAVTDACFASAT